MVIRVTAQNTNGVVVALEPPALTMQIRVRVEKRAKLTTRPSTPVLVRRTVAERSPTVPFFQVMMGGEGGTPRDCTFVSQRHGQ